MNMYKVKVSGEEVLVPAEKFSYKDNGTLMFLIDETSTALFAPSCWLCVEIVEEKYFTVEEFLEKAYPEVSERAEIVKENLRQRILANG